jgi:hypothetical protein
MLRPRGRSSQHLQMPTTADAPRHVHMQVDAGGAGTVVQKTRCHCHLYRKTVRILGGYPKRLPIESHTKLHIYTSWFPNHESHAITCFGVGPFGRIIMSAQESTPLVSNKGLTAFMYPRYATSLNSPWETCERSSLLTHGGYMSVLKSFFVTPRMESYTLTADEAPRKSPGRSPDTRPMSSLCLVILRIHDAVLLDLRLVVVVHRGHELENRRGASASEALDDVCRDELAVVLSPLGASHVTCHTPFP